MNCKPNEDLMKSLFDSHVGSNNLLDQKNFIKICTEDLNLQLSESELKRIFLQCDYLEPLDFYHFKRAIEHSDFLKKVHSYNIYLYIYIYIIYLLSLLFHT